jgi:hypothetical protein
MRTFWLLPLSRRLPYGGSRRLSPRLPAGLLELLGHHWTFEPAAQRRVCHAVVASEPPQCLSLRPPTHEFTIRDQAA